MSVRCQRCSAIGPQVSDLHDSGWQEMTCVASCFDGEETWLCEACAGSLRPDREAERPVVRGRVEVASSDGGSAQCCSSQSSSSGNVNTVIDRRNLRR